MPHAVPQPLVFSRLMLDHFIASVLPSHRSHPSSQLASALFASLPCCLLPLIRTRLSPPHPTSQTAFSPTFPSTCSRHDGDVKTGPLKANAKGVSVDGTWRHQTPFLRPASHHTLRENRRKSHAPRGSRDSYLGADPFPPLPSLPISDLTPHAVRSRHPGAGAESNTNEHVSGTNCTAFAFDLAA
eukprot:3768285-Rhodomonas_salina.8